MSRLEVVKKVKNWRKWFADAQGEITDSSLIIELRDGTRYEVRPGTMDRNIIKEVCFNNYYTPSGMEIEPNDIIIDIGAHIGVFTIQASKKAVNGQVYSFEPDKDNYKLLKKNIELNGAGNITPINMAVSDTDGEQVLFSCPENEGMHSFIPSPHFDDEKNKMIVETVSFDVFIQSQKIPRIDFLKMDCERAEYKILQGCSDETMAKIQKISMEYHLIQGTEYNGEYLKNLLEKKGFKVWFGEGTQLYAKR